MATVATLRDLIDAVIETGLERNNLETIISDLKSFFELVSTSHDLKSVLGTAAFEVEERSEIIADICRSTDVLGETKNFLVLASELDKFAILLNKKEIVIRNLEQAAGKLKSGIGLGHG